MKLIIRHIERYIEKQIEKQLGRNHKNMNNINEYQLENLGLGQVTEFLKNSIENLETENQILQRQMAILEEENRELQQRLDLSRGNHYSN